MAMIPVSATGASVVRFGATLCEPGFQLSKGTCVSIERGECPAGYYTTVIAPQTFSSLTLKNQCMNAYNKIPLPDNLYAIYSGVVVNFGATLCAADEQMVSAKCEKKEQHRCPDGFYKTSVAGSTFSAPSANLGQCMNAYNEYEYPEYSSLIYNGVLVSFGATLCPAGQYMSAGACTTFERGECPADFYQIPVAAETLTTPEMGVCATGYSSYHLHADCNAGQTGGGFCAILCDGGLHYTGAGTCAEICPYGGGMLRTSGGVSYPLYAERQTTPSLVLKTADGVCYINCLSGSARGAINVKTRDKTYHITD